MRSPIGHPQLRDGHAVAAHNCSDMFIRVQSQTMPLCDGKEETRAEALDGKSSSVIGSLSEQNHSLLGAPHGPKVEDPSANHQEPPVHTLHRRENSLSCDAPFVRPRNGRACVHSSLMG